jgi:hypothetical protein
VVEGRTQVVEGGKQVVEGKTQLNPHRRLQLVYGEKRTELARKLRRDDDKRHIGDNRN